MPWVDWGKALASQLIVWHHLVFYGPLALAAAPLAPELFDWLADPAREVVQVFLVMGGYLAARALLPSPQQASPLQPGDLPGLLLRRYWRLAQPVLWVLVLAVLAAWAARSLISDPDIPAAPTLWQGLSNALFLHDIVGQPALSAGLWYVAIDLQLFMVLAALACGLGLSGWQGRRLAWLTWATLGVAVAGSLLWANRQPDLDIWAPYFFGSYGLGVLAYWISQRQRRALLLLAVAVLVGLALWLDWRRRIALAALTALCLATGWGAQPLQRWRVYRQVQWLSQHSYALFLVHYPVSLVVSAAVHRLWPGQPLPNALGLLLTWGASLWAAWGLQKMLASPRLSRWPAWVSGRRGAWA